MVLRGTTAFPRLDGLTRMLATGGKSPTLRGTGRSQWAVLLHFCSLSPTIGTACGVDSTVEERAGVRGQERAMWPPHPHPLPRNMHKVKATSLAGERGPETAI